MLNDDLLYTFITVATVYMSSYGTTIVWFAGVHKGLLWHKCVCCPVPADVLPSTTKNNILRTFGISVIVLHLLLSAKIWWHKKKASNQVGATNSIESPLSGTAITKVAF